MSTLSASKPHLSRRRFFRSLGAGAAGSCLLTGSAAGGRAKHCILVYMAGGPSHTDTFDLKEGPWLPREFRPARFGAVLFPRGLMPTLAGQMDEIALVRSMKPWILVHELASEGISIGRCGSAVKACETQAEDFGDACQRALGLVRGGARLVEITLGGWDAHSAIYSGALNAANPNSLARRFDLGLGNLIAALKRDGLLAETLVIALGEFGRTAGWPNTYGGRDHFLQQAALFAGAGIRGGRAIGATDRTGTRIVDFGWSQNREIRPEDIHATVSFALEIAKQHGQPLKELWA